MKLTETNPFHELYVTDSAMPEDFVRYFSPFLVPHMLELFQEGNVILKGTQGCGKSMLLKLLAPETRVAYAEGSRDGKKRSFPIPENLSNFVSAGVNLSRSGLLDSAQMLPTAPTDDDFLELTALFTDFFNYWLLSDLLESLKYIANKPTVFGQLVNAEHFDRFVQEVSNQDCWFGYVTGCRTFEEFRARIHTRIVGYRGWHARNHPLPDDIRTSKTAVGVPLSHVVECLKSTGVLSADVPVILRVDQMEELWHREGSQAILTQHFRRVINRAIGNRDLRVSFRIGTRRYSWDGDLAMPGGRKIEESRDFVVVDLDDRLRRREDRSGWLFEGFAADVFSHRLSALPHPLDETRNTPSTPKSYFGHSPTPNELVEKLVVNLPEDPETLLKLDDKWSKEWREYIRAVYCRKIYSESTAIHPQKDVPSKDPLNAILAVAWGLQTGGRQNDIQRREMPPPTEFPPWTKWWEKERMMFAVTQLVARHRQTLFWWGTERILSLSASNITLFLSICREVWDQWLRRSRNSGTLASPRKGKTSVPIVEWKVQAVAIDNVSKAWHRNFARQPGRPGGDVRMRFIDELGNWLRRNIIEDVSMSYPGGNGFSLKQSGLQSQANLTRLLEEAVGWGDLYEVPHTTKIAREKYSDPRHKYYLNPILSPHFQIPDAHTKEPLYVQVETILNLALRSRALADDQRQITFGNDNDS